MPCALLLRSTFCLDSSLPPTGGRGVGRAPSFREGVGDGWSCLSSSRSSAPVTRPTVLLIPPQVPLTKDGGAAGGSAVGRSGARAATTPLGESQQREGEPISSRAGVSAADVTPSAATGAADETARAARVGCALVRSRPRRTRAARHGRRETHPDLPQRDRPRPPAGIGPHPLPPDRRRLPLPRQRQHLRVHRGRRARRAACRGRGADAGRAARARDRHRERPQHQRHRPAGRQDVPHRGVQGPLHARRRR